MTTAPVTTRLILRHEGKDYDIGELGLDVPVHVDHDSPLRLKVGHIEPVLAEALREAATVLDQSRSHTT